MHGMLFEAKQGEIKMAAKSKYFIKKIKIMMLAYQSKYNKKLH